MLCLSVKVLSQNYQISVGTGIGFYSMENLKEFNKDVSTYLEMEHQLVEDFPPYFYYTASIIYKENDLGIGLCYNFKSTGSRISSLDYTGEYRFDMQIKANSPGLYMVYDKEIFSNFRLGLYTIIGVDLTILRINEYLRLREKVELDKWYRFTTKSPIVQPGLEINYFYRFIGLKIDAGYMFQNHTDYFSKNTDPETSPYIILNTRKPNWEGFRAGLSVFYKF